MKKNLVCLIKGHKWGWSYETDNVYRCKKCSAWAYNLSYDYQGMDVTTFYYD